ncbi:MAG: alpha/beta hydrolase [Caulobacteraceae bacterium]|nr:alpha/beta hydrolase [Caulobacteraceae bacterium]
MIDQQIDGMVELPSGALFVRRQGRRRGLPGVVLEAGGGATSAWWAHVQPVLAETTEVLAYDRAGLGRSAGWVPSEVDAAHTAARLGALLDRAASGGPWVLVGHSLGALHAQYFAAVEPGRVAGVVLVDPTADRPNGDGPARLALAAFVRGVQAAAWLRRGRAPSPFRGLVRELPEPARREAEAALEDPRHLAAFVRELRRIGRIRRELAQHPFPRRLPLLVVSAGQRRDARTQARLLAEHRRRAGLADAGRAELIDEATHGSILTAPDCARSLAAKIADFTASCRSTPGCD